MSKPVSGWRLFRMYINCILMQGFCLDMLLLTVNVMYGASRCCLILRSEVSLPFPYPWFWGIPIWKGHILVSLSRVLCRIYSLGEKSQVSEKWGASKGGPGACHPGNFLKWVCAEMQSSAFWDTIWRNVAPTSSRLDDFSGIVTFVMITTFFWGGGGGGEASTPQIPYIEPCKLECSARNANTVKSEPLLRSHLLKSRNHFPQILQKWPVLSIHGHISCSLNEIFFIVFASVRQ